MPAAFTDPDAAFADREASGEDLIYAWFGLLALTGREAGAVASSAEEVEAGMAIVQPYLDPAFTLLRATGQRYTAGNYVPLDIDDFELSDFVVTEPRDDIRVLLLYVLLQPVLLFEYPVAVRARELFVVLERREVGIGLGAASARREDALLRLGQRLLGGVGGHGDALRATPTPHPPYSRPGRRV